MIKKILFIALVLIGINESSSQELVFENTLRFTSGFKNKRDILPIVAKDGAVTLFFLDNAHIKSFALDSDLRKIDEFKLARPQGSYNKLLGYTQEGNEYALFFSNGKKSQFFTSQINISEKTNKGDVLDLKFKKERYLESLSYGGKFYLLTVKKFSSILKIYEYSGSELSSEKEFDLSEHKFSKNGYPDLYSALLKSESAIQERVSVTKIEASDPVSLEIASERSKLFLFDSKLFITLDNSLSNTKIIGIDLENYEYSYNVIEKEHLECGEVLNIVSNSFLVRDVLFQVKSCKSGLTLRSKNIHSKELISEYSVGKDELIQFKNGPIKQEGGTTIYAQGTDKELDNTKQILRKISNSSIGISAYKGTDRITLTIGGYKEVSRNTGGGGFTPGTNISTPYGNVSTPATYSYNPTMFGYGNYSNTRAVYFKCVLNSQSLEHIVTADVQETAFDKIKNFEETIKSSNETLFKIDKNYIYGYYVKSEEKYYLLKFTDEN